MFLIYFKNQKICWSFRVFLTFLLEFFSINLSKNVCWNFMV